MAKSKSTSTSTELRGQLAELERERAQAHARLEAIGALQEAASDPEADPLDVGALKALVSEKAGLEGLLAVIAPRIQALGEAIREAERQERAAAALALRPKELEAIRAFEAWLADGVKVLDRLGAMAQEIGPEARCVPNAQLAALVRHYHGQAVKGQTVKERYTDWSGQRAA